YVDGMMTVRDLLYSIRKKNASPFCDKNTTCSALKKKLTHDIGILLPLDKSLTHPKNGVSMRFLRCVIQYLTARGMSNLMKFSVPKIYLRIFRDTISCGAPPPRTLFPIAAPA
ncbi:MAG: hypothetical protein ABS987_05310, partial [Ruminococcus sp.]